MADACALGFLIWDCRAPQHDASVFGERQFSLPMRCYKNAAFRPTLKYTDLKVGPWGFVLSDYYVCWCGG